MTATFQRFDEARLPELMTWFPDRMALLAWGGPEFRHPFTPETFRDDAKVRSIASWALIEDGTLVGFGQCYLRAGRCHIGRLAISPAKRGGGLGTRLIRELAGWGSKEFGVESLSLFVLPANRDARRLYERLGFVESPDPRPSAVTDGLVYMIARNPLQS
jgi:ribosomal protein S18 acetylase RimI-like enzyme